MTDGSRKAILAAFLANMGIAITKFVGFLLTGSASLLAETVHSIADTGNQALLFLGGQRAKKAATPMHPFGYGRERYFWAFAVALILFSLGGMFALYEGIQKLRHPHDIESLPIAIGILLIAIVLEGWSMRTAVHESRHSKEAGTSWWNFIRTTRQPELPVVLLEDLGALCGLFVALVGVVLAATTGNARFDAAGSVAIGVLLVVIAFFIAVEVKALLIGQSVEPEVRDAILAFVLQQPDVVRVFNLITLQLGPDVMVAIKAEMNGDLSGRGMVDAINAVERGLKENFPQIRRLFFEPDVAD